ncbi:uncharacterized protein LOC135495994 [Lineus longissimus]|uniref:uncharacterized protein LOC135495994 n=1 Tax=Lineus longissimus TaxID=88925 RepID=UPI002B4D2A89
MVKRFAQGNTANSGNMLRVRWLIRTLALVFFVSCLLITFQTLLSKQVLYIEDNVIFVENSIPLPYPPITKHMDIPKIIHQTWISEEIPKDYAKWIKSWQENHPGWQYWFWTDADCLRLIRERYPKFLELYESYAQNINRADVIRYFILYEFGGVYADLDMESSKPLDGLLKDDAYSQCFLSQEPLEHAHWLWKVNHIACNAVMVCRRRHPFFAKVVEQLKFQKGTSLFMFVKANRGVMYATGPLMITDLYNTYNDSYASVDASNRIHLVPSHYFYPTIDPNVMSTVKSWCEPSSSAQLPKVEQAICERHRRSKFSNEPVVGYYGNHHWVHTYYLGGEQEVSNIKDIVKTAVMANDIL